MIKVEEVVLSSQERRAKDFMVHTARSCSGRVKVFKPRRLRWRSIWELSFSRARTERIFDDRTKSVRR
jgi:streptogramin lyase